jgi:drug/metabolite transporter (DMT)-like permease
LDSPFHLKKSLKVSVHPALYTFEAVLAIILWGISFITIKIALEEISPVTLIVMRFTIGATIIGAAAGLRGEWTGKSTSQGLSFRDLPLLALVGFLGITLQQLLQVAGQALATASVAGLLASTAPAFTLLLAAVFLGERHGWRQFVGVGFALTGSALVITNGQPAAISLADFKTQGSLLVLSSSLMWAVFTIMTRNIAPGKPAMSLTASLFLFGTFFALPLFIYQQGWKELSDLSLLGWFSILFTAILCTGAAYLLNTHALKYIPASRVASIQMLEPVVVVIAAAFILNETLSLPAAVGGAAILGGVFLAQQMHHTR